MANENIKTIEFMLSIESLVASGANVKLEISPSDLKMFAESIVERTIEAQRQELMVQVEQSEETYMNTREVKLEEAAKAADVCIRTCGNRSCNMSLHKLDCLIAGGNINACACVSLGFGIRVHIFQSFQLFFSVPAVGAELARLKTYRLYDTLERLEFY